MRLAHYTTLVALLLALAGCPAAEDGGTDTGLDAAQPDTNVCTPREKQCAGNQLKTCKMDGSGWTYTDCPNGCLNNACQSQVCTPKSKKCEGNKLKVCNDAGTGYATIDCPGGCQNNDCVGQVCTPNEKKCQNNQLWTCNASGQWEIKDCPYGCEAGACKGAVCEAGDTWCVGNTLHICNSTGTTESTVECPTGCEAGKCKDPVCTAGQKKCEGNQLWTCTADGVWNIQDCPHGCDNNQCKTATCYAGERRCDPVNPKQPQQCKADQSGWENVGSPCPDTCENGVCVGFVCEPNQMRCSDDKSSIEKCKADQSGWEKSKDCSDGCVVDTSGDPMCALCQSGATRCEGNVPQTCDPVAGWQGTIECESWAHCTMGDCYEECNLTGSSSWDNHALLANYLAYCWKDYGGGNQNEMCFVINASALTEAITESNVIDWFCDGVDDGTVTSADFDSAELFDAAEDMFGCCTLCTRNLSFETSAESIPSYSNWDNCIYMDASWTNEVFVNECNEFTESTD